jgi:DNA replication protein DnaC
LWINYHFNLYTYRALELSRILDSSCLEALRICLGLDDYLDVFRSVEFLDIEEIIESNSHRDDLDHAFVRELRKKKGLSDGVIDKFLAALVKRIESIQEKALISPMETKFAKLADLLDLGEVDLSLVRLLYILDSYRCLDSYIDSELKSFTLVNRPILSALLGASRSEVNSSLSGRLVKLDIITESLNRCPELDDCVYRLLELPDSPESLYSFAPAPASILGEGDFFLDRQTMELLKRLLQGPSKTPTHVLFYGPPGVGKTQLARFLAQDIGAKAMEVKAGNNPKSHRNNLYVAHSYLKEGNGRLLIIDEADKLLESKSNNFFFKMLNLDSPPDKSWLDYFLEKTGPTCLWIVNDASLINSSVIRRFAFSLKFSKLGSNSRLRIWRRKMGELGESLITEDATRLLAKDFEVSPGVISQALEKTKEARPESASEADLWLKKQLRAHLDLSGRQTRPLKVPPQYRLETLVTNPPLAEILPSLKNWRDRNQQLPVEERRGLRLLFHGAPGTGKSELANYLAQELELDITRARVSDIISPYVGESEINLARLFKKYELALGLVIIDEVESFIYNRDRAVRSFELSLVNEFLTCLDHFTGLFIGTTNRIADLDPAAKRRLGRRVEFGPLSHSGRLELFAAFLEPLSGQPLTDGEMKRLESLTTLVHSDFSAVFDSMSYANSNEIDNLSLLALLENEASSRLASPPNEENPPADKPAQTQRLIN